ncbi:hypothetical protein [Methanoregula formicica]|uniref:Uncharacterized protein n=1 Tax=Methanoregula formicica (strain DSM 22288 / NBRC 105244 / SMSP) TaxID=593750 RepID=L0HG33_METFS|nr:hypothetical protein [Methanoregula formicica]AGB02273.1 hypothetical protein Metfor_1230 [Methanoregula formicica SMSP]
MIPWLNANFRHFKPTAAIAINATRHMNKIERRKLFSPDIEPMRTAEGRWFEAIVYEMFLDIAKKTDTIQYIAMKGADAPRRRENVKVGQNGLFYSKYGDITIRGNGQDLAEFDMLLVDSDNHVAFAEVVTSPADLKEFEIEIAYKKKLLGYLYNQKITPFLLVSSFDLSNYSVVKRLAKDKTNAIIHTSSCEEIKSLVKHYRPRIIYNVPEEHPKLIRATDIRMKHPFNYKGYHDEVKNRIFTGIAHTPGRISPEIPGPTGQLVKKVLYGGLFPPAIRAVCETWGMTVKGKKIAFEDFSRQYSKAIIATDLPGYELIIYLRSRQKKEYHKLVQMKDGHFKFERPTPPKVGFFLWLETIQPTLGARITLQIIDAFTIHERQRTQ